MDKFEEEKEMLENYAVYMKLNEIFEGLPSNKSWKNMMDMPYCKEHVKVRVWGVCVSVWRM